MHRKPPRNLDQTPTASSKAPFIDAAVIEKNAEDSDDESDNDDSSNKVATPKSGTEADTLKRTSATAQLGAKISKQVKAVSHWFVAYA